jgi:hypothetical protein
MWQDGMFAVDTADRQAIARCACRVFADQTTTDLETLNQAYAAEQQRYDDKMYHKLCLIKKKKELCAAPTRPHSTGRRSPRLRAADPSTRIQSIRRIESRARRSTSAATRATRPRRVSAPDSAAPRARARSTRVRSQRRLLRPVAPLPPRLASAASAAPSERQRACSAQSAATSSECSLQ